MDARFQVCFTPLAAVLFAFPSRYLFAIGHHGVFSLGEWSPRIRTGFHVSRPTWDPDRPGKRISPTGLSPALAPLSRGFGYPCPCHVSVPQPRKAGLPVWASCAFARRYLRNRVCFLLLEVLRCFTSLRVAPTGLSLFIPRRRPSRGARFPHSEISGSKPFGGSPKLIAALCVLHRLMMPRHPSYARIRLARDFSLSRYVAILFNFQLASFKDRTKRCFAPGGGWWR